MTSLNENEIEEENDLLELNYLNERFDEDNSDAKEVEEERNLLNNNINNNNVDNIKAKTVKEDIKYIKEKIKTKQNNNNNSNNNNNNSDNIIGNEISQNNNQSNSKSNNNSPTNKEINQIKQNDNKEKDSISKLKLPSVQNIYSEKPKILESNSSREQHKKLPKVKIQKNKVPQEENYQKRSKILNDINKIDDVQSIEILKRREEEILQAKAKRERLLKEQEDLLKDDIDMNILPVPDFTQKKKTKKKKPIKEFMVKYDSKSGLFGVNIEAERQSRLENYEIQRKMKRNAEKAEIQRARVRLHRHGAYDLYNQGTVSLQGRDLFHEKSPRLEYNDNEGSERLTSLSERKDRHDSDRIETKRSSSAEHSPQRHQYQHNQHQQQNQHNQHQDNNSNQNQQFHKIETQLNHVSNRPKPVPILNEKKVKSHNQQNDLENHNQNQNQQQQQQQQQSKLKIDQPIEIKEKSKDNLKSPLFDFPDYLNDSPIEQIPKKNPSKLKQKKIKQDIQTNDLKNQVKKRNKEKNALDILETEKNNSSPTNNYPKDKNINQDNNTNNNNVINKPKIKKKLVNKIEGSKSELEIEKEKRNEEKDEVMKQLDMNFPDYLNDTPVIPKIVSNKKARYLSRPTKASIASQISIKPKEPEKDIKKKKMSIIKTKSNVSQDESQNDQLKQQESIVQNENQQINKNLIKNIKEKTKVNENNLISQKSQSTSSINENYDNDFEDDNIEPIKSNIIQTHENNSNIPLNSSPLSIQVTSNEVIPSAPASLTPQPPSTNKSLSFSRKNSSSNSSHNSPIVEVPNNSNLNFDELTITGTKIETPASNKSLDHFSPRTLKLESDVIEDSPNNNINNNDNDGDGDYDYDMSFLNEFDDNNDKQNNLENHQINQSNENKNNKNKDDDNIESNLNENKNNENNDYDYDNNMEDVNQYLWNDEPQEPSTKYDQNEQEYQENYGDENYEYIDPESGENIEVNNQNQSNIDDDYYNEYHEGSEVDVTVKSTQYGYSEDFTPYESYHSNQNSNLNNQTHNDNNNDGENDYSENNYNKNNVIDDINDDQSGNNNLTQDESQYYDDDFISPDD